MVSGMRVRISWILGCALAVTAQAATAQGGQGGFGGGGAIGGTGNREGPGDRVTGRSILTPGQSGEWPLTIRDGETIIVHVTSTAFDPAVEIVDSNNKVLAQNDDVRTGEQDSQLLFRFAKPGKYRILVKAFKSAGGGQYELTLRRFVPADATLGARVAGTLDTSVSKWFRFHAERGRTVLATVRAASFQPTLELFSPIGETRDADATDMDRGKRARYLVDATGDYYVRVGGQAAGQGDSYALTIAMAREFDATVGQQRPRQQLEAGGLDVWKLQGKAGDLIRISAGAEGGTVMAAADSGLLEPAVAEDNSAERKTAPLVTLEDDSKDPGKLVALVNRAGTIRVSVSQPLGLPVGYTLSTSSVGTPWKEGANPAGALKLGGSDYWFVDGHAGGIVQLAAGSSQFDAVLEMFGPHGQQVGANDDGAGKRDALLTQLFRENGRYLVRVHSLGDGGSGQYQLRWLPNPVRTLALGPPVSGNLGSDAAGIWSFLGKKDETVILSARSSDFDTQVRLFGPDGLEIPVGRGGTGGGDSLASVRLPLDGAYMIWVTARSGFGAYTIRVIDADR
jgi:hypothetical protein